MVHCFCRLSLINCHDTISTTSGQMDRQTNIRADYIPSWWCIVVRRSASARQNSMWVVVDKLPRHNFNNLRYVPSTTEFICCSALITVCSIVISPSFCLSVCLSAGWMDISGTTWYNIDIATWNVPIWRECTLYAIIICTPCLKKCPPFSYHCSFYKCWPISVIFGTQSVLS